jgi:hypothetical protein
LIATYGGLDVTKLSFWLRAGFLILPPILWFVRAIVRLSRDPKPFEWWAYMRGVIPNTALRDALRQHWKVLAYLLIAIAVFIGNVMSEAYRAGIDSTKIGPPPQISITWDGHSLDQRTILLDDVRYGEFTLRFDFQSSVEIPHPAVIVRFSRRITRRR